MTVQGLIEHLKELDPTLYVCGSSSDESLACYDDYSLETADIWNDALPEGVKYVQLHFSRVVPHVRGEPPFQETVPPPTVLLKQKCKYCGYEVTTESHTHCNRCSWKPMLEVLETLERSNA